MWTCCSSPQVYSLRRCREYNCLKNFLILLMYPFSLMQMKSAKRKRETPPRVRKMQTISFKGFSIPILRQLATPKVAKRKKVYVGVILIQNQWIQSRREQIYADQIKLIPNNNNQNCVLSRLPFIQALNLMAQSYLFVISLSLTICSFQEIFLDISLLGNAANLMEEDFLSLLSPISSSRLSQSNSSLPFFKYHSTICWMSFSRSLGPQQPRSTTTMGLICSCPQQKIEQCESIKLFQSQFLQTLLQGMYLFRMDLPKIQILRFIRLPWEFMNFTVTSWLSFFIMAMNSGTFRHQIEIMAMSEAEPLFFSLRNSGSDYMQRILSNLRSWQQLLTSSQKIFRLSFIFLSLVSYTLQYSFCLFLYRQAPTFTARIVSQTSLSSMIIK